MYATFFRCCKTAPKKNNKKLLEMFKPASKFCKNTKLLFAKNLEEKIKTSSKEAT